MADILVIDDDNNLGIALQMALKQMGHQCRYADNAQAGWKEYQQKTPDLALLDLRLPDSNGLDLMERMRAARADLPVIIMTGFATVTSAVAALKGGAADFIEKPLSVRELCALISQMLDSTLADQGTQAGEAGETELIAASGPMRQVLSLADRIAALPNTPAMGLNATLITGETGTGKEMLARYIHQHSPRRDRPFIQVNCTAIPENLFESELFGHERGSFTDAKSSKVGLIEAADGGTLFLDEIADIPMSMQGKLLIAIETGRFRRLGATSEQKADIRIIAATNRDLEEKTRSGEFRADLYHRLKIFYIALPPLRDRGDDITLLAHHFLERFCRRLERPLPEIPEDTWAALRGYAWPGNVRELAHVLLRALVAGDGQALRPEDLGLPRESSATPDGGAMLQIDLSQGGWTLAAIEKRLLSAAMQRARGNIAEAARLLRMPRGTLRYRLEKLGLISNRDATDPAEP
ncbi:MAG TPA: sigma-54 dependent transcriptional regulator [Phycisphaerae bacterium]|jgi:DNA-binding NtrC family response regulator|nr:sigma-54-dependent Fis family transcriptional regulator [Phycisphaerae bacterium]HOB74050.1 sigma-54 dependent transcriptional regulator [Phycisphaerae bacterium]HOJ53819.1 sigma-54 dependent transcriptional regulator [Phycisphaerae bacterium]HOL26150.1 sigma-54 dependent transcriptional regulator [Phycisphaerae bacterium]HPP20137.1 sigma-54 dependent transcriptional regulator [Phycisphaerae bacterium]